MAPEPTPTEAVPWLDDDEQTLWRGWLETTARITARVAHDLRADSDLAGDDYEVLVALSEAPDRQLRMADLATRTIQPASRLSQRIDRLTARGLVERRRCDQDRRGQFAVLTDEGFGLLEVAAPHHVRSVRRHFLDHLTRADIATLAEMLPRLAAATRDCPEPAPSPEA